MQHLVTANTQFSFRHLQLPLHLFSCEDYADLSMNAKVVYALILNRIRLSQANNQINPSKWSEEDGSLFAVYPRSDLASDLNLSKVSIIKCIKELIARNLILEKRKGQGKTNRIYLVENDFLHTVKQDHEMTPAPQDPAEPQDMQDHQEPSEPEAMPDDVPPTSDTPVKASSPDLKNVNVLNSRIFKSRSKDSLSQEVKILYPNYNNNIYTDPENIDSSITDTKSVSHSLDGLTAICNAAGIDQMDDPIYGYDQHTKTLVRNSIHYLFFLDSLTLGNATYPQDYVRDRLQELSIEIIDKAMERLSQNRKNMKNVLAYTAKTLFSCILESETSLNVGSMYGKKIQPNEGLSSLDDEWLNAVAEFANNEKDTSAVQEDKLLDAVKTEDSHGVCAGNDTDASVQADEDAVRKVLLEALGVSNRNPTYSENSLITYAVSHGFEPTIMKTVVETTIAHRGRFSTEYASTLLADWENKGLHTMEQLQNTITEEPASGLSEWEQEWLQDVKRFEQMKNLYQEPEEATTQEEGLTSATQKDLDDVLPPETMDSCPNADGSVPSSDVLSLDSRIAADESVSESVDLYGENSCANDAAISTNTENLNANSSAKIHRSTVIDGFAPSQDNTLLDGNVQTAADRSTDTESEKSVPLVAQQEDNRAIIQNQDQGKMPSPEMVITIKDDWLETLLCRMREKGASAEVLSQMECYRTNISA